MSIIHVPPRRALLYPDWIMEAEPTLKFYDSFTDDENALLADHIPDIDLRGNGWTEPTGISDINSNRLSGKTVPAIAVVDVEEPISVQCLWKNPNDFAYQRVLLFRYDLTTDYWYVDTRPTDNYVALKKLTGGGPTTVDTGTFVHAQNNWYGMRVVVDGNEINVYCGADLDNLGVTPIVSSSGDSTHENHTKVGTHFQQVDQRIDDFSADTGFVAPI